MRVGGRSGSADWRDDARGFEGNGDFEGDGAPSLEDGSYGDFEGGDGQTRWSALGS